MAVFGRFTSYHHELPPEAGRCVEGILHLFKNAKLLSPSLM